MLLYPYPHSLKKTDGIRGEGITVVYDNSYRREEYNLSITADGIKITARDDEAVFRAKTTLKQLDRQNEKGCYEIHDYPDIEHRGITVDISRSKIPSVKTIKRLIDMLADLKMNELQLYIEGYPFAYKHYPEVWKNYTPLTPEDIKELDAYCRERYVDLVPNQNCFGHMSPWLILPEFKHLAECPDGFIFQNEQWQPMSIDPSDPNSFEFIKNLYDDLLPCFSSDTVNICCDETLELGKGKNKERCVKEGTENVYIEFLLKVINYVKKYKKNVQFWGDIIMKRPELLEKLPENVIPLNWGYSKINPSEKNCQEFQRLGMKFYNACGTQSWNTILGNTETLLQNVDNGVLRTIKYGGIGSLVTDWGDLNHPQYLPISYPGYCYHGAMSWNATAVDNRERLVDYLDTVVFKDTNKKFGTFLLDAGRYFSYADFSSTKRGFVIGILYYPLEETSMAENADPKEIVKLQRYLDELEARIPEASLTCDDAQLVVDEIKNAILIMRYTCELLKYKLKLYDDKNEQLAIIKKMQDVILPEHKRLWRARNNESDLAGSIKRIQKIFD